MKITHTIAFALCATLSTPAFSQDYQDESSQMDDTFDQERPRRGDRRDKMHSGKGPLPHEILRRHADKLGITEDVLQQVEEIVMQARDRQREIRRDIKKLQADVHYEMDVDSPDRAKVMDLIRQTGELKIQQHQGRVGVLLEIRSLLTSEQKRQMKELMKKRRAKHRRGEGKHGRRR